MRAASVAAGMSNTMWGLCERGEIGETPTIRQGVAEAFGWSIDWPDVLPSAELGVDVAAELEAGVSLLRAEVSTLAARVERLERQAERAAERLLELGERVLLNVDDEPSLGENRAGR